MHSSNVDLLRVLMWKRWSSDVPPDDAIPTAGERRSGSIKGYPRTSAIRSTSQFDGGSNL